jgi:RNA polymerase sigma factor (sigma-70 family)
MQSKQIVSLKEYKNLIETIAKMEYQKLAAWNVVEYLELVNIATQALYCLFKNAEPETYNNSYLATAIKWAIRNEVRRRYKWYAFKNKQQKPDNPDEIRVAVYKTILSIDEIAEFDSPTQIKDERRSPEESFEFLELKSTLIDVIKRLPKKERDLIESKFFKNKKLKEIAIEFDLSPSRASRIIQSALVKIKIELNKKDVI